jgi:multidrug resistance efflux pump
MTAAPPAYPAWRKDLEIVAQAAPGRPGRHLVRDPRRHRVFEFTAQDIFLARQLDGHTPLPEIHKRFEARFGQDLRLENLEAFVRQLHDQDLLDTESSRPAGNRWSSMKAVPIDADRWFRALSAVFLWAYTWPATVGALLLAAVGARLIAAHWDTVWHRLSHLLFNLRWAGYSGAFAWGDLFQIAAFITVLPFFREMAKGTTCRHYGYPVVDLRHTWFLRVIPRCIVDISAMGRANRTRQIHIAVSGMLFEWGVVSAGMILGEIMGPDNPLRGVCHNLAVAASIRLILNLNPFGKLDGCLVLTLLLGVSNLRDRSLRMFRAWLLARPMPEPASPSARFGFVLYGLLATATDMAIDIAILGLLGYLLICQLEGTGAVFFLVLVALKYERNLRDILMSVLAPWATPKWKRYAKWAWLVLAAVVVLALIFVPYTFKAVGEFRVQPCAKHEIRAQIAALIEAIPVEEGQSVSSGDVLVRLSPRDIAEELELQRAALKREEAYLHELEAGATKEEIDRTRQKVTLAGTALSHSEKTLRRVAELYEKKHVPEEDYDAALRQRDMDRESLELSKRDLDFVLAGERPEKIEAQRAEAERLQVTVKHLEGDLTRTALVSPIDGSVTTLYIEGRVGEQAEKGEVLAIVENTRVVSLRIAVPEGQAGDLKPGAKVAARAWALPNRVFEGSIRTVLPAVVEKKDDLIQEAKIDQTSNAFRNLDTPPDHVVTALVDIPNEPGLLKSDMTGFAKIAVRRTSLGYALLHPIVNFFRVRVWSWMP